MTEQRNDDDKLRDSEIALVDALKTLMEIMVSGGIVKADVLQRVFAHQRDGYITKSMPNAAVIMEVLRGFAGSRAGTPPKDALREALEKPPQGSA